MFQPYSIVVHKVSPVTLKKIICTADDVTGEIAYEETDIEVLGNIRDSHFAEGAMKYAFDFKTSNGEALVTKRFSRLAETDAPGSVPVLAYKPGIYLEMRGLAMGGSFTQGIL
ncbi:hypothetical protein R3P38DRAFT_3227466 [Favolaschia claudopus]|uniref:Uncharacterized protein n=1 Tax=Favolaschia claudopus TaxID=2862362 RepID=A0AAV9ZRT1_9AGAR